MTKRSWSKDRQRELTRLARSQSRSEADLARAGKRDAVSRRQASQSVAMTIRCYSCGHGGHVVLNMKRVRRPIRLKCSQCGEVQKL